MTLSEVADTQLGKMLKTANQTGQGQRPYLRAANIVGWGRLSTSDLKTMDFTDDELDKFTACRGDLLVTEGGDSGRCVVYNRAEPIPFQNHIHRVRAHPADTSNSYLALVLEALNLTGELDRYCSTTTIKMLSSSSLRSIEFRLPGRRVQDRIVDLLTSADRMVTALQAELTAVTDVRSQLLLHLVGPSSQGDTGKTVPLGEVSEIQYGKGVPAEERPPTGFRYVTSSGVTGYTSKALVSDDVIVIGRKGSVGVIHLIRGGCWPSDTTFYSKPINDRVGIDFLALTLEASDLVSLGQASAVPGLSRDRLAAVQIPLPSRNEQRRIVDLLMSTSLKVTSTRQRLTSTLQLREQLLHDLLSGGHTIPESYDRLLNGSQP